MWYVLKIKILNTIKEYEINLSKCIGKGYDRANIILGIHGGLEEFRKEQCRFCSLHALNLIFNDAAKHVPEVSSFFDNSEEIYTFLGVVSNTG